ncbi:hypothetical protein CHUAL_003981 [Chamberlinius hualienensis]
MHLSVLVVIFLHFSLSVALESRCFAGDKDLNNRFDCLPDINVTKTGSLSASIQCTIRGCCWSPVDLTKFNLSGPQDAQYPENRYPIHIGPPPCYYSSNQQPYYQFTKTIDVENTINRGKVAVGQLKKNLVIFPPFSNNFENVKIEVFPQSNTRLRIKISDASKSRYEVPVPILSPPNDNFDNPNYEIEFGKDFGFAVSRKDTGETIFNATVGNWILADQFLQLSAILPTQLLYGLSQSHDSFARSFNWQKCPLFAVGLFPDYGSHPFYLSIEKSGKTHGVFLFNSNPMDVILQPTPAVTYRVIGGVLDFYFFFGPTPEEVIQQYNQLIGIPTMIPYWSLGFHLNRYGYGTLNNTMSTWKRNVEAGIPFDVQWNDIDFMDVGYKIFTYNNVTFKGLPEFVNTLHQNNMRYIVITDAGIAATPGYGTYDRGLQADVFIKNYTGGFANGKVWPNVSVFTDFTHSNVSSYWTNEYEIFHSLIAYDGSWIDMNEVTTFSSGSIYSKCPQTKWDNPPYVPEVYGNALDYFTICMSSQLQGGVEYNLHSLYGFTMSIKTHKALETVLGKRAFVLTRSTAPGNGKYSAHWTGDVYSSWQDLQQVIPSILNMNLFGIPMVGSDICGFRRNTTFELCQRWTQLGAFQPFARNHNEIDTIDQDPAAMGPEMVSIFKNAFNLRYTILPFMYTQFYRVTTRGGTVIRPLFFEFLNDSNTYFIQDQFLWGKELMIFPILEEGMTTVDVYFPEALWYFWPDIQSVVKSNGKRIQVDLSDPKAVSVAIRGGSIIPTQQANTTTNISRKNKFGLIIALDEKQEALGELFWDDGDSIDTLGNGHYSLLNFTVKQNYLRSQVLHYYNVPDTDFVLKDVTVMGMTQKPIKIVVNNAPVSNFNYDANLQCLRLEDLSVPLSKTFSIDWSY